MPALKNRQGCWAAEIDLEKCFVLELLEVTVRAGWGRSQQALCRLKLQCISPGFGAEGKEGGVTRGGVLPVGSKKVATLGEDPGRQGIG